MGNFKDSVAARLFNEDFDEDEITPGSKEQIQAAIEEGTPFIFKDKHGIVDDDSFKKLTPAQREDIAREVEENGFARLCRCVQSDFKDPDIQVRMMKATLVNLYFEYGGNWMKVFKDPRSCSRRAMAVYWRDELFRAYIAALDPILLLEARGVVVEVWKDGLDEKARLAAALAFLEAHDPYTYDRGVRKQVVANKGSLQSALFNRVISDDEFLNTYIKDKLNRLPDNVRAALGETLSKPVELPATEEKAPTAIRTADMNKLTDPFGD